ncbi:hypothetical protein SLEP1_g55577 [Rubroshorea leprosula]|uniref:Glycosyl hydrolase family 63 N-terminal domain-containing protein n=1 Tax=Rubroshorea leprosula TaxID=152421 RepID=A0AAV5MFR9_9ROSI|nr:hypothetical protein SLEP1_g55577 [Rubroshorea leprosula]
MVLISYCSCDWQDSSLFNCWIDVDWFEGWKDMTLETSFLKAKGGGSAHGGDWAVRIDVQSEKWNDELQKNAYLVLYLADEDGSVISLSQHTLPIHESSLLASVQYTVYVVDSRKSASGGRRSGQARIRSSVDSNEDDSLGKITPKSKCRREE